MAKGFRGKRKRDDAAVRVDLNGATDALIGAEAGISQAELDALRPRLETAIAELQGERAQGLRPFLELPFQRDELAETLDLAERLRPTADWFVMLGVGGSALGARTLAGALGERGARAGAGRSELVVVDNIDPSTLSAVLERIDLRRAIFNVVSRSGETAETMAQFLVVRELLLREFGAVDYIKHLLITTDADSGSMRQIVNDEGFFATAYPSGVPGHFSILTAVHLLPAALLDIDVDSLLAGAAAMAERCSAADPDANPAARLAAARYLLDTLHGVQVAVLMAYSDRLAPLTEWWRQLWAESLGKRAERDGVAIAVGHTPVPALGATDQHSQLQLYLDGPADKVITFLRVEDHGARLEIPRSYPDIDDVAYLGGHSLGELLNIEQRATELALAKRGRPTITIEVPEVSPYCVGQLLYLLEVEAALAAALYGVDPYRQPGVDEVKRLACGLGGKPGFEDERREMERWLGAKQMRYLT
jgi:glucose-6-phosphate isomerase